MSNQSSPSNRVVKTEGPLQRILEYTPRKFELGVPQPAMDIMDIKKRRGHDFEMAEVQRVQTGLNKLEALSLEDEVDRRTLEKLKSIQEGAYQEAYQLGLQEGTKEAFEKSSEEIGRRLSDLDQLITAIRTLKQELLHHNENHVLQLVFQMASRLAAHEVKVSDEAIVSTMRKAIEMAQLEEEVVVQVAPSQFEFLEELKKQTGREFEFLKKVKLAPTEGIGPGGCVIETNYGVIDARFEERMKKLWETLSEYLPRVKNKVSAA